MSNRAPWLATMLGWALASGCATAGGAPDAAVAPEPHAFYPLESGNAWSYDVDTGDASTTLAVTRVEGRDGMEARVRTGAEVVRYEVLEDGIRTVPEGAWLFRAPFVVGSEWPAPGGRRAQVVSIDAEVSAPAGSFEGCLDVLETGGDLDLEIRTVYCPGVGPVRVESTMRSSVSERSLTVTATLRGYQVTPR
jgi:hypothetical protein